MSSIHAFAWLSAARCDEIAKGAEELLTAWATAWGVPAQGAVACQPIPAGAAVDDDYVDLLAPPQAWGRALAQALFKFDTKDSAVVGGVVLRVTSDLRQRLQQQFALEPFDDPATGSLGHQGVQILVDMLGRRCGFVASCAQLRASGWLLAVSSAPLQPVNYEHALAATPVPLVAELGRASVDVSELMQLSPGDVLLLNETLNAPLRVVSPGSELMLSAHLGADPMRPSQRAARWLASRS